jgi:hypothetical protein
VLVGPLHMWEVPWMDEHAPVSGEVDAPSQHRCCGVLH